MRVIIDAEQNEATEQAAETVRTEVFGSEWGVVLPRLTKLSSEKKFTLVAREALGGKAVAALTAVETTGDVTLHQRYGLDLGNESSVRYTQLAVLGCYRGQNLPLRLTLEAQGRFVAPKGIKYTWLLFDAGHAATSSFCTLLGYKASGHKLLTEYGCSRVLVRDESGISNTSNNARARAILDTLSPVQFDACRSAVGSAGVSSVASSAFTPTEMRLSRITVK